MLETILFLVFGTVAYWGVCQMFSVYDHRCLTKDLYITVKNPYLWHIFAGRVRGRRIMPQEDWYKISIAGIVTYIALLPVLLEWYCLVLECVPEWMPSGFYWSIYCFAVIFINILDDILGKMINRE